MRPRRAYSDYLRDILEAIGKAQLFTVNMSFEDFSMDEKTVYATVRALEIVGEATKRLPVSVRELQPLVPWRDMSGMRDVVIHQYDKVDLIEVWKAARTELPAIEPMIAQLLEEQLSRESKDE